MKRREFINLIGGVAAAWPIAVAAQQPERLRLIGVLMGYPESDPTGQSMIAALRSGLSKLGWTEGNNLRIELCWGGADPDRVKTFAKELVDLRPDLILSHTTAVTGALARETRTIPIVFVGVTDPISSGFAPNLARPGGNITGFSAETSEQGGKWVELLKQIAPRTVRIVLLLNPETSAPPQYFMLPFKPPRHPVVSRLVPPRFGRRMRLRT
jgi:putative ABC transport system substrate-binding protein